MMYGRLRKMNIGWLGSIWVRMMSHGHFCAIYAKGCVCDVERTKEEDRTKELHSHNTISHTTQQSATHLRTEGKGGNIP